MNVESRSDAPKNARGCANQATTNLPSASSPNADDHAPDTHAVRAARILVDMPPVPRPLPASLVSTLRACMTLCQFKLGPKTIH